MRVLIFGCDRLSANLVDDISRRDNQVTVIGDNRDCLEKISSSLGVRVVLMSEPMMQDYLQEGSIDHCDVLLAMSSDDHQNLLVSQIA